MLRGSDALEPELAQGLRLPAVAGRRERRVRVRREQHLAAVRGGEHPAGAIEHRAEVVPAARLDLADVDRHAHAQRLQPAPVGCGEQAVDLARGSDRSPVSAKARSMPSPTRFTSRPPAASTAPSTIRSCCATAERMASVCSSQRTVEPSISVSRKASACTCGSASSRSDGS